MKNKEQLIKVKIKQFVENIIYLDDIKNKTTVVSLAHLISISESQLKNMDEMQELIAEYYNVEFTGCECSGQTKLNELCEEYMEARK